MRVASVLMHSVSNVPQLPKARANSARTHTDETPPLLHSHLTAQRASSPNITLDSTALTSSGDANMSQPVRTTVPHTQEQRGYSNAPSTAYTSLAHNVTPVNASATSGADSFGLSTGVLSTRPTFATAQVQSMHGEQAALEHALDTLADARPPGLFYGRYAVLRERARGSQALVQFARDADSGKDHYAIKVCSQASVIPCIVGLQRKSVRTHTCSVGVCCAC